jgi:hypothetical protein
MIRRTLPALLLGTLALTSVTACGANDRDVEGVDLSEPAKIEIFGNIDGHPNLAISCLHGVAFVTTTRGYGDAVMRVPELDKICPAE